MSQITLYDIPSKGPHRTSWSFNPWKTRLALNYKGLDYETIWLEYPDIAPTLKSLNIPQNDPAKNPTPYSCPTLRFTTNNEDEYIMDSREIANRLEEAHPSPSLHLDSPHLPVVMDSLANISKPMIPIFMPLIPRTFLTEASAEYFERTREQRFGMPLQKLEEEKGGEAAWREVEGSVRELGKLFEKEGRGPFVMGDTVSYADLVVVSFLHCMKLVDTGIYDRLVKSAPALGKVYDACAAWLERDDH